jgi:HK97 family phage prohead protease
VRGLSVFSRSRGALVEARTMPVHGDGWAVECRAAAGDDGEPSVRGYATVYGTRYDVLGGPAGNHGGWTEIIHRGAASRSVQNGDPVYMFFDHDGLPLAGTKNGTLQLVSDNVGLLSDGTLDAASPYAMEIHRRVQRKLLDSMSFAFEVTRERWEDEDGDEANPLSAPIRRIQQVKLYDVAIVSFPANPAAWVQSNSAADDGMSLADAKAMIDARRRPAALTA